MLPTFVIGLREGLEAALIVGIVAAFLRKQERTDLLRWVWAGVGAAVLLCLAVGGVLEAVSRDLPQRQQEGLETVVGALAVAMVTYMVVWMRRHSRELKGSLEGAAASALTTGSGRALVAMAFLAVIREGFETVVFLLATFNEAGSGPGPVAGAILGIAVAVGLGWGVYRGGVRINLSRFFRATGLVLVLVAAGLVMTALHTAHEAGWLNAGQGGTVDLSWVVHPGSVQASLLTGILGVQPRPVVVEVVGWLVYLVPVALYVGWPAERRIKLRTITRVAAGGAIVAVLIAGLLVATRPSAPSVHAATIGPGYERAGTAQLAGLDVVRYSRTTSGGTSQRSLPANVVANRNGGRLPLGLTPSSEGRFTVDVHLETVSTLTVDAHTRELLAREQSTRRTITSHGIPIGTATVVAGSTRGSGAVPAAVAKARHDGAALSARHDREVAAAWLLGVAAALALLWGGGVAAGRVARREPDAPTPVDDSPGALVQTR